MMKEASEVRNGLRVDWNVPIEMRDGIVLRADVFRPLEEGKYPVILSYGPYAKGMHFRDGYASQWESLQRDYPEIFEGTTADFFNWETVDPEKWVPNGYVCVRVDSRGAGQSQGYLNPWSVAERDDIYECIEWAGTHAWSDGNVGMAGVSYYATNQWHVGVLNPPHLKAICPFEGYTDSYREAMRQGGMMCTFLKRWYPVQVTKVQHGLGSRAYNNPLTGEGIAGDVDLSDEELRANRADIHHDMLSREMDGAYYRERSADVSKIKTPLLSCGNWGGQGLHLRGNIEGYLNAGSEQKWLELHGREHWTEFYTNYGLKLQRQFFDHFLKGEDNGWDKRPPVLMQVRHIDKFVEREEQEWPLVRTQWTHFYFDIGNMALTTEAPANKQELSFEALGEPVTFLSAPLEEETEITGPMAAKLFAASSTVDADIFMSFRLFDPTGREVLLVGAVDPNAPISLGWLRASHRKLDKNKSTFYRPYHTHDEKQPLEPGKTYELDVEVWPTCIVAPKGYRIGITIGGKDYEHSLPEPLPQIYGVSQRGCSVMVHDDPGDRPAEIFGGTTTITSGGEMPSSILVPIIPEK